MDLASYVAGLKRAKGIAEHLSSLGDKIIVVDWLLKEIDKEISRAALEDDDGKI